MILGSLQGGPLLNNLNKNTVRWDEICTNITTNEQMNLVDNIPFFNLNCSYVTEKYFDVITHTCNACNKL